MLVFQRVADQCLMKWIHPDDFTLLTRSDDKETYMEIIAENLSGTNDGYVVTLNLCTDGPQSSQIFTAFITSVQAYLENMSPEGEFQ